MAWGCSSSGSDPTTARRPAARHLGMGLPPGTCRPRRGLYSPSPSFLFFWNPDYSPPSRQDTTKQYPGKGFGEASPLEILPGISRAKCKISMGLDRSGSLVPWCPGGSIETLGVTCTHAEDRRSRIFPMLVKGSLSTRYSFGLSPNPAGRIWTKGGDRI